MRPQVEQGTFWARVDACGAAPVTQDHGGVIVTRYDCPAGRGVELRQVKDNGHAWPGGERGSRLGDMPSTAIDATAEIWAFFKAHPRAPAAR
jgi:polyhydroxybutyrate depolymerase